MCRRSSPKSLSERATLLGVASSVLVSMALVVGPMYDAIAAIGGLDLAIADIVGAFAHVTMLGIFFGMFALAIGAATSKSVATGAAAGVATVAYLTDWLLEISYSTDQFARLSTWFYASDAEAIVGGPNLAHLGVLAMLSTVAFVVAVQRSDRREIAA